MVSTNALFSLLILTKAVEEVEQALLICEQPMDFFYLLQSRLIHGISSEVSELSRLPL